MNEEFETDPKLSNEILLNVVESLYSSGVFNDDDIKDRDSNRLAFQRLIDKDDSFDLTTSHTQSLSSKAKAYKKANEIDYSRMFYATFFEHQINELIHLHCIRNKLDTKTQTTIIQSVNIRGKFTWLLQLMNYPKFNKNHLNTVTKLADSRNSFVHYKWKPDPDLNENINLKKEQENIDEEFIKIEKAIKYFKTYCSKVKYNGNKKQIQNLFK